MENLVHPPYMEFKGWLCAHEITYADLGRMLNLAETTISQKINGKSDFYLSEIRTIQDHYDLDSTFFLTNSLLKR